ncbi:MAG TPA: winged helix-turn-helix transcriptional regulator [Spirochaetia bacterium]|nr:winged helix-turn-helix transcriptional regulator [Spirochaetia bacterium]
MTDENQDTELALLERVREAEKGEERLTQRGLAQATGLSLGMTNALVRKLADRGWLKLTRLNAKSFRYALTPEGVNEVARRTVGYFRRASRNASLYRDRIEAFVLEAKRRGAESLVLVGPSEADFVIEYACERHGLTFLKSSDLSRAEAYARRPGYALVWGERLARPEGAAAQAAPAGAGGIAGGGAAGLDLAEARREGSA